MNTITFDTHKIIDKLQRRGFSKDQAEGVIEVLTENEFVTSSALDDQTKKIENVIITQIANKHVAMMKWITGVLIAQAAAIVALQELIK